MSVATSWPFVGLVLDAVIEPLDATGASLTGTPVMALVPVIGAATPSLTLVSIVKLLLKFGAGLNVTPASRVLTSARAPLAVQTPFTKVEVTAPEVAVVRVPAAVFDSVNVAVTLGLSGSVMTISIRLSGV